MHKSRKMQKLKWPTCYLFPSAPLLNKITFLEYPIFLSTQQKETLFLTASVYVLHLTRGSERFWQQKENVDFLLYAAYKYSCSRVAYQKFGRALSSESYNYAINCRHVTKKIRSPFES